MKSKNSQMLFMFKDSKKRLLAAGYPEPNKHAGFGCWNTISRKLIACRTTYLESHWLSWTCLSIANLHVESKFNPNSCKMWSWSPQSFGISFTWMNLNPNQPDSMLNFWISLECEGHQNKKLTKISAHNQLQICWYGKQPSPHRCCNHLRASHNRHEQSALHWLVTLHLRRGAIFSIARVKKSPWSLGMGKSNL